MRYFLFWFLRKASSFFRRCYTKLNREIIFHNSQCVHDISESDVFDNFNLFSFNFLSVDVCEVSELWSFCIFFLLLLRLMNLIFYSLFDIFIDGSQTLPKAQRTRGLSSTYQSNFLRSYNKFSNIFSNSQILKHFQNLDQAPTSKSQTNISISKKLKLESLDQI